MKASDPAQTSGVQTCFVMNSPEASRTVRNVIRLHWLNGSREDPVPGGEAGQATMSVDMSGTVPLDRAGAHQTGGAPVLALDKPRH
jgi:hypothetical protein